MKENPFLTTEIKKTVLERARVLVQNGWVQGVGATDNEGVECSILSPEATCFCPSAAIVRVCNEYADSGEIPYGSVDEVEDAVYDEYLQFVLDGGNWVTCSSIPYWNDKDERTKEEVLSVFDKTIASLGKGIYL